MLKFLELWHTILSLAWRTRLSSSPNRQNLLKHMQPCSELKTLLFAPTFRAFAPTPTVDSLHSIPARFRSTISAAMSWFDDEFGTAEEGDVAAKFTVSTLSLDHSLPTSAPPLLLTCVPSQRSFYIGPFETPTVQDLRSRFSQGASTANLGKLSFSNIAGDAVDLHANAPKNAVFMAASQFNCLEMISPGATPKDGITRYIYDPTQGPACAMACPAGTLYRNYLCQGAIGQVAGGQINTAWNIEQLVGNAEAGFWEMKNGYLLPKDPRAMQRLNAKIEATAGLDAEIVRQLAVGIQWDSQLAAVLQKKGEKRRVCQVYCSAVPVSYSNTKDADWEKFARLVLTGAYEATVLVAALLAQHKQERIPLFLTAIGGGAFGNKTEWIADSLQDVLVRYKDAPVDVSLVHFRHLPKKNDPFLEIQSQLKP